MTVQNTVFTNLIHRILSSTILLILLGSALPALQALVFSGEGAAVDLSGKREAHIAGWGKIDLSGVVLVRSPYGVPSSGVLLSSGRHVLTAAHCVAQFSAQGNKLQGRVEVFSGTKQKIMPWKKVYLHPAYSHGGAWDAAIIELAGEVGTDFAARYPLAGSPRTLPEMILRTGWGKGGTGMTGESGSAGKLLAGLNHHEARTKGKLAQGFKSAAENLPLLISDFDGGPGADPFSTFAAAAGLVTTAGPGAGDIECHIANGDSGGPVFARDAKGKTVVVALQVGRIRRGADIDHRLNSSWGELSVDVEACRIRDWILSILSR
jgi:hypothetical protein